MQPHLKSLSTARWLELPIYGFADWEEECCYSGLCPHRHDQKKACSSNRRVSLGDVAEYYVSYVDKMDLKDRFLNGVTVTDVTLLQKPSWISSPRSATPPYMPETGADIDSIFLEISSNSFLNTGPASDDRHLFGDDTSSVTNSPSRETSPNTSTGSCSDTDDTGIDCGSPRRTCCCLAGFRWRVRGKRLNEDGQEQDVVVCAKNVVLASGVDHPRRLCAPGEELPFVKHSFSDLSFRLSQLADSTNPVLVVGAGLSAADAILLALAKGLQVVHVFYQDARDPKLIYHKMPRELYSEYCHVSDLMQEKVHSSQYLPLAKHQVTEFKPEGVCIVRNEHGSTTAHHVSLALVLIGSKSELMYMPRKTVSKLGLVSEQPIHTKKNPVDIDSYSFECEILPSLYALGPLVGDNFVRFVLGGALGITKSLHHSM